MVSKQTLTVLGLQLTVYGLEEYKNLPEAYPASIMFALHGRLRKFLLMPWTVLMRTNRESGFDDAFM